MTGRGPRLGAIVVMGLTLAATLAPLAVSGAAQALLEAAQAGQSRCFQETGKCVRGAFLVHWQQHGGLEQFGFPVSDEIIERNAPPPAGDGQEHLVQYFERARFEFHENPGKSQGNVKLGLLGSEQWQARHAANPPPAVQPQAITDPFAFCAQAGTVDYPAWLYQGKVAFTGEVRDPASGALAGLRCLDGKPLICTPGASDWSCQKVNPSQTPPQRTQLYCQIRGQDGAVPGAYVDRTSIYLWTCRGGQAVIDRQVVTDDQVDERGYLKEAWRPLPGGTA
jgi:hypothetical protein